MSTTDNINNLLDGNFENHNFLPQKLELEDFDQALFDFIKNQDISVFDGHGKLTTVPMIYLTQELWAEAKYNWAGMTDERGKEIGKPFITLVRTSVQRGQSPLKYTIPVKKRFRFVKVPTFDGTLKGYDIYKIPQPAYVDMDYDLRFVTHYMEDVNYFYEKIMREVFSDGQAYMKINGYDISSVVGTPNEDNDISNIDSERVYQISFPITVRGKLVDPTDFEKVNTVTKISIKINEC